MQYTFCYVAVARNGIVDELLYVWANLLAREREQWTVWLVGVHRLMFGIPFFQASQIWMTEQARSRQTIEKAGCVLR
jgi:hypothetical protein